MLEKGYLAGGNTARNTAIIRSNYLTPEGVAFYEESVELYQRPVATSSTINIMYSERGHFTLAHTDAAMRTSRWRAEVNKHLGVNSEVIYPDEIARLCPAIEHVGGRALSRSSARSTIRRARSPATTPSPGAMRKGAAMRGVEVHTQTEVTGILDRERHASRASRPTAARSTAGKVMQAVAGSTLAGRARWPASSCRSAPSRCRPASPSR